MKKITMEKKEADSQYNSGKGQGILIKKWN